MDMIFDCSFAKIHFSLELRKYILSCWGKCVFLHRHSEGMTGHIKDVELNVLSAAI